MGILSNKSRATRVGNSLGSRKYDRKARGRDFDANQMLIMRQRFTIDGSERLEQEIAEKCREIGHEVGKLIPGRKLEALVLGGGYGRGQGGVLLTEHGDRPYNDLEFYVFLNGNRLWNERRYKASLDELGQRLSPPGNNCTSNSR